MRHAAALLAILAAFPAAAAEPYAEALDALMADVNQIGARGKAGEFSAHQQADILACGQTTTDAVQGLAAAAKGGAFKDKADATKAAVNIRATFRDCLSRVDIAMR